MAKLAEATSASWPVATPISLSVCVPALNEAPTLRAAVADLVAKLSPAVARLEIIVVNDGSQDETGPIAEALARELSGVRVVHHPVNRGLGAAYRSALAVATGDYYTWFPADQENLVDELVQAVRAVEPGALVTTQHVATDPRPPYRRLMSRSYTALVNRVFGLQVRYYNGLTIYPTAAVRAVPLAANGFVMQAEALIRVARSGLRVIELEYPLGERKSGRSALVSGHALKEAIRDGVRIWRAGR